MGCEVLIRAMVYEGRGCLGSCCGMRRDENWKLTIFFFFNFIILYSAVLGHDSFKYTLLFLTPPDTEVPGPTGFTKRRVIYYDSAILFRGG